MDKLGAIIILLAFIFNPVGTIMFLLGCCAVWIAFSLLGDILRWAGEVCADFVSHVRDALR